MTARIAYEQLLKSGRLGMDDPNIIHYSKRWYFNTKGILCESAWRSQPKEYPEFKHPKWGSI